MKDLTLDVRLLGIMYELVTLGAIVSFNKEDVIVTHEDLEYKATSTEDLEVIVYSLKELNKRLL